MTWTFEPTDPGCGLKTYIGEAVGAASMCWENVNRAGIFDSTRAQVIVEAIYERAMSPDGARLGMATTAQLLEELRVRLQLSQQRWYAQQIEAIQKSLHSAVLDYRTVD